MKPHERYCQMAYGPYKPENIVPRPKEDVTIQGLKTTIERLETQCFRKDERINDLEKEIKRLEETVSNLGWRLTNSPEERIDW